MAVDPTEVTSAPPATPAPPDGTEAPPAPARSERTGPTPRAGSTVTYRDARGRRQEFEARKVRRLLRHVDPWSMLKASLVFFVSVWLVVVVASVIVWSVARGSGTVTNIEDFIDSNFSTEWRFDGGFLLRGVGLVGLISAILATLATTVGAVMFNLISDVIGGIWITVIEEETLRPVDAGSPVDDDVR